MDDGRGISKEMEDEVFGLCGAVLGMLEVILADSDGMSDRQRGVLQDALRYGHMLRERVEAMALLASGDLPDRLKLAPCPVRRWVTHAARGAASALAPLGVQVALPEGTAWGKLQPRVDVSRMDRALRAMIEGLGAGLGCGGQVVLRVAEGPGAVRVELQGVPHGGGRGKAKPLPALLCSSWRRLLQLHGGTCAADPGGLSLGFELPVEEP